MSTGKDIQSLSNRLNALTTDELHAFDLQLTLLRTAFESYKRETVFKPCPTFLVGLDDDQLRNVFRLPPVTAFISILDQLSDLQISLLNWLLTRETFKLNMVPVESALSLVNHQLSVPSPNFAFQINYNQTRNERFNELTENGHYKTFYAYHGTRFDNLHSILHIGFLGHMNKLSLFGSGTYFSVEPSVSLHYSPFATVWPNSLLGKRLSCLLLCEIIDQPDHVKCAIENETSTNQTRSIVSDTQAGAVPEKYVVVTSNELVRVKYILIYSEPNELLTLNQVTRSRFRTFFSSNRYNLCLIFYFILLLLIGFFNSNLFKFYWRLFKKRSNHLLFGSWHLTQ
jgi:poly[ADP-ribose] polymerase 16